MNESKRLTFPDPVDDSSVSLPGVVRVVAPDTANNVLLVEAQQAGKTTLTVYVKGEIYRYFISTFENRGADVLEIQNAFSAKGYRSLTITFDKDQATIGGTVPTQEELDDAVRIVKQYTEFVVVKANLGQEIEESEYSEQEAIIINNIQRIANVKGLIVRVKFPLPSVITTSSYTKSTGDYIEPTTSTTPQGGTIRGSGFQPPANPNEQGTGTTLLEPKPQENTTAVTTTTEDTSIPEKICLYGDLQDDLDEAKAIRVARTFCPFIVNFLTVRDPIQIRTQIRFMQVRDEDTRDTGFDWSNGGAGPTITLGFGGTRFSLTPNPISAFTNFITSSTGAGATVDAAAIFRLYETLGLTKILREADLFLTNGQPGWYSEGEVQSYVSSAVTTASSPPLTTLTASSVFLGVNMDISPLNLVNAGGTEPSGQKIFGIPSSVGAGSSSGYNLLQDAEPTADKVG
jgi:Flp pilus assembly secretin CpaC